MEQITSEIARGVASTEHLSSPSMPRNGLEDARADTLNQNDGTTAYMDEDQEGGGVSLEAHDEAKSPDSAMSSEKGEMSDTAAEIEVKNETEDVNGGYTYDYDGDDSASDAESSYEHDTDGTIYIKPSADLRGEVECAEIHLDGCSCSTCDALQRIRKLQPHETLCSCIYCLKNPKIIKVHKENCECFICQFCALKVDEQGTDPDTARSVTDLDLASDFDFGELL